MIDILIADDHKVFREGLHSLFSNLSDIRVIGEAADGREVLALLENRQPDIILMDIAMGDTSGIDTTRLVKERYPEVKILVLSMHAESQYVVKMLEAGASGYLLKDAGSSEMITAIHTVYAGDTYYSRQVSDTLIEHLTRSSQRKARSTGASLTRRELEVLQLIAEEYSNPEIAEKLSISIRTVDTHRRNLLEKLDARNTAGLVKHAIRLGLIRVE